MTSDTAAHLAGWARGNLQRHLIFDHDVMPTDALYDADLNAIHRDIHDDD